MLNDDHENTQYVSGDKYVYTLSTSWNVSDLINSSEVDAKEVYDNKRSKQITWIIPLLMTSVNLVDFLTNKLMSAIISITADGWM